MWDRKKRLNDYHYLNSRMPVHKITSYSAVLFFLWQERLRWRDRAFRERKVATIIVSSRLISIIEQIQIHHENNVLGQVMLSSTFFSVTAFTGTIWNLRYYGQISFILGLRKRTFSNSVSVSV